MLTGSDLQNAEKLMRYVERIGKFNLDFSIKALSESPVPIPDGAKAFYDTGKNTLYIDKYGILGAFTSYDSYMDILGHEASHVLFDAMSQSKKHYNPHDPAEAGKYILHEIYAEQMKRLIFQELNIPITEEMKRLSEEREAEHWKYIEKAQNYDRKEYQGWIDGMTKSAINFLKKQLLVEAMILDPRNLYASNGYIRPAVDYSVFNGFSGIGRDKYYTVYYDPLTLDLNNDGKLNVVGTDGGVHFDFNNDGLAGNTGWVGKDDGLLIFDANEDNNVTNGSELFGEGFIIGQKVREDGTIENIYAKNGFEALASLDTNKDGIVDANDKDFDKIKVWQDKNGNGKVDAGEMLTLKELGIVGLNTGYQKRNETSFIREDDSTGLMGDINFILYFSQTETVKSIL